MMVFPVGTIFFWVVLCVLFGDAHRQWCSGWVGYQGRSGYTLHVFQSWLFHRWVYRTYLPVPSATPLLTDVFLLGKFFLLWLEFVWNIAAMIAVWESHDLYHPYWIKQTPSSHCVWVLIHGRLEIHLSKAANCVAASGPRG